MIIKHWMRAVKETDHDPDTIALNREAYRTFVGRTEDELGCKSKIGKILQPRKETSCQDLNKFCSTTEYLRHRHGKIHRRIENTYPKYAHTKAS